MQTRETSVDARRIVQEVSEWPVERRVELAHEILQSCENRPSSGRAGLRQLLGLLKSEDPPPDDDECRRLLDEELTRKYGG